MKILKKIQITLILCVLVLLNNGCDFGHKRQQYSGVVGDILNRSIAKFTFGEYAGLPRNAPPCKPETTVKEAFDQPCKIFKLSINRFNDLVVLIDIEFYSLDAEKMFSENSEFVKFMEETANKINNRQEILEIGDFADKKNKEYVRKGSDASEVDRTWSLFSLIKRYINTIKFHSKQIEIWRK